MEKLDDIKNKNDIIKLVNSFYAEVVKDELIGLFFKDINWENHLPTMYVFWENVLFYTGNYIGNPMLKHKLIHESMPFNTEQFNRWVLLFTQSVDKLYSGEKAELIKERANNISIVMQLKILQ